MFDHTPQSRWKDGVALGDILLFRFPTTEDQPDGEAPKRRPCLVLETPSISDHRFVWLAYGTSADGPSNRGREVLVKRAEGLTEAGLYHPTRFVGNRTLLLSLDHPGFEAAEYGDPRIGRLDAGLQERMHAVRARMHAEAHITAEHHREARAERHRWHLEGRKDEQQNRKLLADSRRASGGAQ